MALASGRTAETLSEMLSNNSTWTLAQPATEPLLLGRNAAAVPHVQARPVRQGSLIQPDARARPCHSNTLLVI